MDTEGNGGKMKKRFITVRIETVETKPMVTIRLYCSLRTILLFLYAVILVIVFRDCGACADFFFDALTKYLVSGGWFFGL